MQQLTHGEAYVQRRQNMNLKREIDSICDDYNRLPKRMSRSEASAYYGKKIRDYFIEKGLL